MKVKYLHTPDIQNGLEINKCNDSVSFIKFRGEDITKEYLTELEKCNKHKLHELHHLLMYYHHKNQYNSCYSFIDGDFGD